MSWGGYNMMYGGMGGMGMGGMGGMGMGGSSTTMMSSALAASMSMSALAAVAYFVMRGQGESEAEAEEASMPVDPNATPAPVTSNLDGAKLLTVGDVSMNVEGNSCGNGTVRFSQAKTDKWLWNLKKAGEWSGVPYYTIESAFKNFNMSCNERFLTAPTGCKSPPYLAKAEFGPRQYWLIMGDAGKGYQLRSLACARGRYENQYLMQSVQDKKARPMFSSRSGSTFFIENENTA